MLLFIGTGEIIFILIAVLLLFGSKKIPEFARALGRGYREFQKATDEIKREISKSDIIGNADSNSNSNSNSNSKPTDYKSNEKKPDIPGGL